MNRSSSNQLICDPASQIWWMTSPRFLAATIQNEILGANISNQFRCCCFLKLQVDGNAGSNQPA